MKYDALGTINKKKIKIISLFSGCGGMDLGFEGGFQVLNKSLNPNIHHNWFSANPKNSDWIKLPETIFETVFANDILPAAKAAWIPYFTKKEDRSKCFFLSSIVDLVKSHTNGDFIFPQAELVIGGFPCQDFSIAGKRNGFNSHKGHHGKLLTNNDDYSEENRGKLYVWMKKVIEIVKPKIFVAENVKGIISLSGIKNIIENDFKNIGDGYIVVDAKVLFAPNYGIPQSRERIIFLGFKKSALTENALKELSASNISKEYNPYPTQTHSPQKGNFFQKKKNLLPYVTVGDYIKDLTEPDESTDFSHRAFSKAKWYGKHCQGQVEVNLNDIGPTIRAEHHGNIEFRRLSIEHGGKNIEELSMNLPERRLTVRECARIQTFPDDFEFVRQLSSKGKEFKLTSSDGYRLVGNAVPPLLAFHIAWRLQELWPLIMKQE